MFDHPVPGESLTRELGSAPWQKPPQYSNIEDVIEYYTEKLSKPKKSTELVALMDNEIPISVLVNSMMLSNVMEGVHTIDSGVMVSPLLVEILEHFAEEAGIEYTTGLEEDENEDVLDSLAARKALKEVTGETMELPMEDPEEQMVQEESPQPTGLMARGV